MRLLVLALALVSESTAALPQQPQATGPVLTLEESIQLALRNNPTHLQTRSSRSRAGTALRSAYGAWLPQVSSSFGTSFRAGGPIFFEGQQFGAASDVVGSSYSLSVGVGYSAASIMAPRQARANLDAAEATVRSSEQGTRSTIVQQYLNVLQAQARAVLQDTLQINAQAQLELNRARQQVGAATTLDVRNAEVTVSRQQVAVLRERNQVEIETLRLFQQIGIDKPDGVRLVTEFPVSEPRLQLAELLGMARQQNPALNATRARESAANVGVAMARSRWIPSISIGTTFSGSTQKQTNIEPAIQQQQLGVTAARRSCLTQDSIRVGAGLSALGSCDRFVFTDDMASAIRSENDQYPFQFLKNPFGYSISLSLPIFDGFRREEATQGAQLGRNDARYALRAQELQTNTDVTTFYRNVVLGYQTVQLNEQSKEASRQALALAQERYRVGASSFIEVTQARSVFEQEATNLINAIYDYHKAYATLENAVGQPLR